MTRPGRPEPTSLDGVRARLEETIRAVDRSVDPLRHPLGIDFRPFPVEDHLRAWERLAELSSARRLHDGLVLYVHVPFCARVCGYCLLASRPSGGRERIRRYLAALEKEMGLYGPRVRGMTVHTVHVGGGTPTLLTAEELDALFTAIRRHFTLAPALEIGVEAHPTTTSLDKMRVLARSGVTRVSFGVETFEPRVLAAVQRGDQTEAGVRAAVDAAREAGIAQVNVDLLAGLPEETLETFEASVRKALSLRPDSMSVNRYLAESSPLAAYGYVPDAAEHERAGSMLSAADRIVRDERPPTLPREALGAAGFGTQYVWSRDARPYFQSDMIGPASVLTLGHGALGHLHGGSFYTAGASLERWTSALLDDGLPEVRVHPLGMRFERAFYFVDRACRGAFDDDAFRRVFSLGVEDVFGPELTVLVEQGRIVREGRSGWRKPASRTFQSAHLLAFLQRASGGEDVVASPSGAPPSERIVVDEVATAVERLRALDRRAPSVVLLVLPRVLAAHDASALREAAERSGWGIEVERRDPDAALRQYGEVGTELPPSVLWCRIAMAAARAARADEIRSLVR